MPCGTTGESPTLSHDEWRTVIKTCVETAKGRVPVIAGAGNNNTAKAVELAREAKELGADAVLTVVPYYNKPTQEGLYQHFKAISEVGIPMVLYNVPGRTVASLTVETMARLAKLPNVIGNKDATANLERPTQERLACGEKFCLLSGEDGSALAYLAMGGHGCISVTANVAPKQSADLQKAWAAGDMKTAARIRDELADLNSLLFCETNPGPVKYIASLLGLCELEYRLPLVAPSAENQKRLRDVAERMGLLKQKAA